MIEIQTSRMQSGRSTTELHARRHWWLHSFCPNICRFAVPIIVHCSGAHLHRTKRALQGNSHRPTLASPFRNGEIAGKATN